MINVLFYRSSEYKGVTNVLHNGSLDYRGVTIICVLYRPCDIVQFAAWLVH